MKYLVKSSYINLDSAQILRSPTAVLLGISQQIANVLQSALCIRTVFDLATSHIFANASIISRSAEGEATVLAKFGLVPSDVIDRDVLMAEQPSLRELADKDIEYLLGIGPRTAPLIKEMIDTHTIRDLAHWPPYLNACAILQEHAGGQEVAGDDETPADLLPINGRYPTERTHYNVLIFDKLMRSYELQPLESGVRIDIMETDHQTALENNPAFGAMLTYTQSWYTLGLTLGQLLHSLALAPGESTRVAVIDWARQLSSRVTESAQESEVLTSSILHTRSIKEVVSAVTAEMQHGESQTGSKASSENFGFGFGYGTGTGATGSGSYGAFSGLASVGDAMGLGLSYGQAGGSGHGWAWSSSQGKREIAADTAQQITDRTHQASMATRDRWASVVREVSQQEHETLSTRSVTNFNHMHAMTVQYYEVVQLYRVVAELTRVQRCIFLPMAQLEFSADAVVKRFRHVLAAAALTPAVQMLALADLGSLCMSFPNSTAIQEQDRSYYLDWGTRNGVTVKVSGRSVILNSGGDAFDVSGFQIWNPEGTKKENFLFKSLGIEFSDGTFIEQELQSVGDERLQTCPRERFYHPSRAFPLDKIRRMLLRKNPSQVSFSGSFKNVDIILKSQSGTQSLLAGQSLELTPGSEPVLVWELAPVDYGQWTRIKADLAGNTLHYSQAVWQAMDPAALSQVLSGYSLGGKQLLDMIDIKAIGVAGSFLVFPLHLEDADWTRFINERGVKLGTTRETIVALPSGGVFAEAVLGRANSAEKLDITRFWNWSDSPIPIIAPDISSLSTGSRADIAAETEKPQGFGAPLLNIINPPAVPDPTGLAAILTAIQNGNMFRDMSGLAGAIGLAQSSLASAMQAAQAAAGTAADEAKTAMMQAGKNLETAAKAFEAIYGNSAGGASGAGAASGGSRATNAPPTISNLGAKFNAAEQLDRQQAQTKGASSANGSAAAQTPQQGGATATQGAGAGADGQFERRDTILGTDGHGGAGGVLGQLMDIVKGATPAAEPSRAWPGLDRNQVLARINTLRGNANDFNQGGIGLCTAAAFYHHIIQRDPSQFYWFAEALYHQGISFLGQLKVAPGDDLRRVNYNGLAQKYAHLPPQADWMLMAALRDSENWFFDYEGTPDESIAMSTSAKELSTWYEETGLYTNVTYCDDTDLAAISALDKTANNHIALWVAVKLLNDPRDGTHMITLESPMVIDQANNTVTFDYWTWGQPVRTLTTTVDALKQYYYGAITASF